MISVQNITPVVRENRLVSPAASAACSVCSCRIRKIKFMLGSVRATDRAVDPPGPTQESSERDQERDHQREQCGSFDERSQNDRRRLNRTGDLRLTGHRFRHARADQTNTETGANDGQARTQALAEVAQTCARTRLLQHQQHPQKTHVLTPPYAGLRLTSLRRSTNAAPSAFRPAPPLPGRAAARFSPGTRPVTLRRQRRSLASRRRATLPAGALAARQCACRISPMKTDDSIAKMYACSSATKISSIMIAIAIASGAMTTNQTLF